MWAQRQTLQLARLEIYYQWPWHQGQVYLCTVLLRICTVFRAHQPEGTLEAAYIATCNLQDSMIVMLKYVAWQTFWHVMNTGHTESAVWTCMGCKKCIVTYAGVLRNPSFVWTYIGCQAVPMTTYLVHLANLVCI